MTPELSSSGLPQSVTEQLANLYKAAAAKLRQIAINPTGRTAESMEWNQARAAIQSHQVDRLMAELRGHTAAWIGDNLPITIKQAIAKGNQQARELGVGIDPAATPLTASLNLVNGGILRTFARDIDADLRLAAKGAAENAKRVLRKSAQMKLSETEIDRILAGGTVTGQPAQAIRELRDALRAVHGEKVIIRNKNGEAMEFDSGYYAKMVASTKTREAMQFARHERLSSMGLDLVSIVGRISRYFCTSYLGMVFSLTGKSPKYPSIAELPSYDTHHGPPFHPNCSKSTRPFIDALATETEAELAGGLDDADKMLNCTPSQAQRRYTDLQLHQQIRDRYATTASKLFGPKKAA